MQTSAAALDLAHARPRPVHWLATAAAMAAVVAAAGLLQPEAATASQTPAAVAGQVKAAAAPAPDASGAAYPLDCRGEKPAVVEKGSGDLDGDGRPETVAVVRCVSGIGTPPSGVFVLTGPSSRVVATLVDPADGAGVTDFAVRGGAVRATLLGYSSPEVPRCCPDRRETVKWQWRGGKFARTVLPDARSM